jgi:transposase-like protein
VADWLKIKTEYISTDISYRKIAEKYGISFNTLKDRAVREGWKEQRDTTHNRIATTTQRKVVVKVSDRESDRVSRILALNDTLLQKAALAAEQLDQKIVTHRKKIKTVEYNDQRAAGKPTKEITTDEEILAVIDAPLDRQGIKLLASALKDLSDIAVRPASDEQSIGKVAELMGRLDKEADDGVSDAEATGVQA